MPKKKKYSVLRVLVASPDDVGDERSLVKSAVDEINTTICQYKGIHLELVGWESLSPGFGSDPQDVVNQQVGDDYDIFVGILWARFGTPTPRADSGTEEEFERAYARHREDPSSIRLLLYFSDIPIPPSQIDPEQFARVRAFRGNLSGLGGLYSSYRSRDEFAVALRINLAQQVQEWGHTWGTGKKNDKVTVPPNSGDMQAPGGVDVAPPEAGFLDLVEIGADNMQQVAEIATRMTVALSDLGGDLKRETDNAQKAALVAPADRLRVGKRVMEAISADMLKFVTRMDAEIPLFARSYSRAMDAYGRAALLLRRFPNYDEADLKSAVVGVGSLRESIESSRGMVVGLREAVAGIPPMSTSLNQAKHRTVETLASLDDEFRNAVTTAEQVESILQDAITGQ